MAKFRKEGGKKVPAISTASLPDIVFMLLFFFMTTTSMKETPLQVTVKYASATELVKLEQKSLVKYIYIGQPTQQLQKALGTEPRIQLNDAFAKGTLDVEEYITRERTSMREDMQGHMIVSLKIDKDTKMGIVTDVKQALRNAYALKINYTAVNRENRN
jgi:biopolymer transport protein ExbD